MAISRKACSLFVRSEACPFSSFWHKERGRPLPALATGNSPTVLRRAQIKKYRDDA